MSAPADWLVAGRVARAHGLDGSVHVSRPVGSLLALGVVVRVAGEEREIVRFAGTAARPIIRLAGCENREAAEALRGAELFAPRAQAPELAEDEWWAEDLVGCAVHDGPLAVGVVGELRGLPSCELLVVERGGGGGELLVPLVRDAVRAVDVAARSIDIDLAFLGEA